MTEPEVPECGGLRGHTWEMSIEEGFVYVQTQTCGAQCKYRNPYTQLGMSNWEEGVPDEHPYRVGLPAAEYLFMDAIPVTVGMATDCPAYPVDEHGVTTGEPPRRDDRGHEHGSHWIQHPTHCDCDWWPVITCIPQEP